jgi:hypothetical protein
MSDDRTAPEVDDAEILAKFRNLLNKYQSQGRIILPADNSTTPPAVPFGDKTTPVEPDEIPLLTEAVILHSSIIQPQPLRLTPIRQILDAALEDAGIEMNSVDRKALVNALENRLRHHINPNIS